MRESAVAVAETRKHRQFVKHTPIQIDKNSNNCVFILHWFILIIICRLVFRPKIHTTTIRIERYAAVTNSKIQKWIYRETWKIEKERVICVKASFAKCVRRATERMPYNMIIHWVYLFFFLTLLSRQPIFVIGEYIIIYLIARPIDINKWIYWIQIIVKIINICVYDGARMPYEQHLYIYVCV